MKCQHCLVHEANFHYRSTINGQVAEHHLCADCAQRLNGGLFAGVTASPMEALFGGGLFGSRPFFAPVHRGPEALVPHMPVRELRPQKPLVPLEADDTLRQRRALNALRQEMQTAIEAEKFERAAELRDELYRLEKGM